MQLKYIVILHPHPMLQEDVPAGGEESEGSEDSDSDDEDDTTDSSEDENEEDEESEEEPLSLDWPDTRRKQATYLALLPIIFPLWVTIPDVRNRVKTQRKRKKLL